MVGMNLKDSRCVRLSDGYLMPVLGLGTYALEDVSWMEKNGQCPLYGWALKSWWVSWH